MQVQRVITSMARSAAVGVVAIAFGLVASMGFAQQQDKSNAAPAAKTSLPDYGTKQDVALAQTVWRALTRARLVGPDRIVARPTKGEQPHGAMQQITSTQVEIDGVPARAIVKANHRGTDLKEAAVYADPFKYLTGYAVMVQRPAGYDPANADWFWAVFNPDGSLRQFNGVAIAGRVDTGSDNGCIGCHRKYGGKDFEVLTER